VEMEGRKDATLPPKSAHLGPIKGLITLLSVADVSARGACRRTIGCASVWMPHRLLARLVLERWPGETVLDAVVGSSYRPNDLREGPS
jgi:hypothetical protein